MHKPFEPTLKNQHHGAEVLLLNDGSSLTDLTLVREVPDKRHVYQARWQDQPVYAKLFFGKNNAHYASRDLNGVRYLMQAEISTPPLLFQGHTQDQQTEVLIFLAIEHAKNAETVWHDCD
ncbi:MAG TPA: hypothetical protein VK999_05200, partial [Methylotenera sp.]|nr:hypothetical protein [Methylotenera sp.]